MAKSLKNPKMAKSLKNPKIAKSLKNPKMAKSLKQHKTFIKGLAVRFEGNFAAFPLPLLKKITGNSAFLRKK